VGGDAGRQGFTERVRNVVAIAGGAATGKSTVLSFLSEAGFPTISSDALADDMWSSPDFISAFRSEFGGRYLVGDDLDRPALRQAVFSDLATRSKLNRMMHKPILRRIAELGRRHFPQTVFAEVPLAVETVSRTMFGALWVTACPRDVQLARLAERPSAGVGADAVLSAQLSEGVRVAFADAVIRTNQPFEAVRDAVAHLAASLDLGALE
jgi:dephospho-CoA kinase